MSQPQGTATEEQLFQRWLNEHSEDGLIYGEYPNEYVHSWNEEEGGTGHMKKVLLPTYIDLVQLYGI